MKRPLFADLLTRKLASDLWAERNTSYGKIMPKLFDSSSAAGNWRYLQEFESGDAADRESWDMAVEYVRKFGAEWRVEREGVFVKRQPGDEDKSFDESAGWHDSIATHSLHDGHDNIDESETGDGDEDNGPAEEPEAVFL